MLTIEDLLATLQDAVMEAQQLAALKVQYKKLARVLHCILIDSDGVISNEDWFRINTTDDGMNYSYSVSQGDKIVVTSHVETHV